MQFLKALIFIATIILSIFSQNTEQAEITLEDINTDVQNINTGVLLNQSGIIVLNNVNFGVIFQQFGEFNSHVLNLAESLTAATGQEDQELVTAKILLQDIATQVQNINTGIALNQSGIVVVSNSNFGTIVQQFGEFYTQARRALRQLQFVDADIELEDVNTDVQNTNTGIALNQSGIVSIQNSNFGTIFQQFGQFTSNTVKTISEAIAPENNGVTAGVELNDINTVVQNINSGIALNQSGIVVIDNSNFGTVIQQFGEFNINFPQQEQEKQLVRGAEQNTDEVDASVDISDVNTIVQNIDTAFALNQSGIIVLNNVNFGVLFQQFGEFNTSLESMQKQADQLAQFNYANQSNLTKKFLRRYVE